MHRVLNRNARYPSEYRMLNPTQIQALNNFHLYGIVERQPNTKERSLAICSAANRNGLQPEMFEYLLDHVRDDLNREFTLYAATQAYTSQGLAVLNGPLWLVLLLCVGRSARVGMPGALAFKSKYSMDDWAWIDHALSFAEMFGADLSLARTVTWNLKRKKPALQAMVAELEPRILRKAMAEAMAQPDADAQPKRARARL